MQLLALVEGIANAVYYLDERADIEIKGLSLDSRQPQEQTLFFCLTGGNADGHAFAKQAVQKGAKALVVEKVIDIPIAQILVENSRKALSLISSRFYGNSQAQLQLVGITGTNGKTTTSYMLESILRASGKNTGIIGTLGTKYNGKEYPCDLTTPDAILLHKLLADMYSNGVEYVVMEVSAHALHYYKTEGISFVACIFTNCTQDHLDFFPDMSAYEETKKRLFFDGNCPLAILNGDDKTGRKWGKERLERQTENGTGERTYFYGINEPSDAFAVITEERLSGSECLLNIEDEICPVSLSMTGRHNVYNALAAATCAVKLGVPIQCVSKGLAQLKGVDGRLEWVAKYNGAEIFVDFAHTPDGLAQSLSSLKKHCKGRLLCLFGCGGNRDKSKRPVMGETVAKLCDFAVLTSDNPRFEDPLDILSAVEKGYRRISTRYVIVPDRTLALEYAVEALHEGDVLLVAGKGGEQTQEIMGIKYEFNDNAMIAKILKNKTNPCV